MRRRSSSSAASSSSNRLRPVRDQWARALAGQLPRAGRNERQRVDLAVGMVQGDADLLATVLEAVDVLDAVGATELGGPVRPGRQHGGDTARTQRRERRLVLRGEAHDLAAPGARRQRREPVLEHDHVVAVRRDLGGPGPAGTGTAGSPRLPAGTSAPAGARRRPPSRGSAGPAGARRLRARCPPRRAAVCRRRPRGPCPATRRSR